MGTVWVESAFDQSTTEFVITPAIGKWSGFGRGAGGGAILGCAILGWPVITANPFGVAIGLVGCASGATVGALSGGVYGAVAAEPKQSAQKAMAIIHDAMRPEASQRKILDRVRARTLLVRPGSFASERDEAMTRLEISLTAIQLDGLPRPDLARDGAGAGVINPEVRLVVTAQARLIRSAANEELYSAQLEHWGGRRDVLEWAEDDGAPLRRGIERALDDLAEQIVDVVFLLDREPQS
ncbi:MAG: hypothetical protein U0900_23685 [Myxococcota bacterium]